MLWYHFNQRDLEELPPRTIRWPTRSCHILRHLSNTDKAEAKVYGTHSPEKFTTTIDSILRVITPRWTIPMQWDSYLHLVPFRI